MLQLLPQLALGALGLLPTLVWAQYDCPNGGTLTPGTGGSPPSCCTSIDEFFDMGLNDGNCFPDADNINMVCAFNGRSYSDYQTFTFPASITAFDVELYGEPGAPGDDGGAGGQGDIVTGTLAAAPFSGQAFIYVGAYYGTSTQGANGGGRLIFPY
ncbi:hypothetical protein MNV49_003447 [Pseudohyphozyma bogoriensis]|nr:hypothetical protein MNV49_003447 [Pseudohyphozyma bogoriensis]